MLRYSLKHLYGALGIGRNSNAEKLCVVCQFYIVHNKQLIPRLDGNLMIIGQVFQGLELLDFIRLVATDMLNKRIIPVKLKIKVLKMKDEVFQEKVNIIQTSK